MLENRKQELERARERLRGDPHDLDPETAATCVGALRASLAALEDVRRTIAATEALFSSKPRERLEAYVTARLGLENLDNEELRSKYPDRLVVSTYLAALEHGSLAEPIWRTVTKDRPLRVWRRATGEDPRDFACRATAERWGFASQEACRRHLWRLRDRVREDPTGWRAEIDLDAFRPPQGADREL